MIKIKLSILLGVLVFASAAHALDTDKDQIIQVMADRADVSQLKHLGVYTGHVALTQGTTGLKAQSATTQGDQQNKLTIACVYGNKEKQAHFWTQPKPNSPLLHAYADTIKYYPQKHLIELIGHARVAHGTQSLSSAKISYDTLKSHVISERDETRRTTIILHPEKKEA